MKNVLLFMRPGKLYMTSEEKKLLLKIFENVSELPKRVEPISGQMYKYVKLEDVVEILQEIELNAALTGAHDETKQSRGD